MRMTSTAALTLAFGLCVTLAGIHTSPAALGPTRDEKADEENADGRQRRADRARQGWLRKAMQLQ